jgi:hypothetical protein
MYRVHYNASINGQHIEASEKNGKAEELHRELEELFQNQNISDSAYLTSISAPFLRITVDVPSTACE